MTMDSKPAAKAEASKPTPRAAKAWLPDWLRVSRPDGIVIGRSVVLRIIHFFSGDVTETRWYRSGSPPPAIPVPANIRMFWLTPDDMRANPNMLATPPDVVAERLKTGARCLVAVNTDNGELVYHLWVTDTGAYIDWIFKYIAVPAQHLMVFDVWVHPDYRGGNVHWAGAAMACAEALRRGRTHIYAGVEEHEFYPFAMKYARTGIGAVMPHSQVFGVKILGVTFHFDGGPSPALAEFGERLRAMQFNRDAKTSRPNSAAG